MPGAPLALHRRYDLFRFLNLRSGTRRLNAGGFHALDRIFLLFPAVKRLTDEIRAETAPEREKIRRETCEFFPAASDSQKRKQYREDDADTDAYPAVTPVLALQSYDSRAVVDEHSLADCRARVNFNARPEPHVLRNYPRKEFHFVSVTPVCGTMPHKRLYPGIGKQHHNFACRGRIFFHCRRHVTFEISRHFYLPLIKNPSEKFPLRTG